jgi:UDP-N-acetyl-D-mannosaminuronic acid dehydrogenase
LNKPSICVIGLGYIGLPTALLFANRGFRVTGCDINPKVLEAITSKVPPFEEQDLKERLSYAIESGHLQVSLTPVPSDFFILTVQTPIIKSANQADLRYLKSALKTLIPYLKDNATVIVESTIPPKTMTDVVAPILREGGFIPGKNIYLAHVPEHALVGILFYELENNSRLVGGIDPESTKKVAELYRTVVKGKVVQTDATTAEFVKIIENTYRDINIAFANELAKYAESIGVNVWEAIDAANQHPRVHIHRPGPGVGGECIAVDPLFLLDNKDVDMPLVRTARQDNDSMPGYVVARIKDIIARNDIASPKVAILGLSFKANVSDARNSPSIDVCRLLEAEGMTITSYDPHARLGTIPSQKGSLEATIEGVDLAVILVDHKEFRSLTPQMLSAHMRTRILYDTKNCMNRSIFEEAGFKTYLLGMDHY